MVDNYDCYVICIGCDCCYVIVGGGFYRVVCVCRNVDFVVFVFFKGVDDVFFDGIVYFG